MLFRVRGRERKTWIYCSTCLCSHWLTRVCIPNGGRTRNPGILERCSKQLSCQAIFTNFLLTHTELTKCIFCSFHLCTSCLHRWCVITRMLFRKCSSALGGSVIRSPPTGLEDDVMCHTVLRRPTKCSLIVKIHSRSDCCGAQKIK